MKHIKQIVQWAKLVHSIHIYTKLYLLKQLHQIT